MPTVNELIRDAFIEHDIDLRRVDGGLRRRVDERLDRLGVDLKALLVTVDPMSAKRQHIKQQRLKALEKKAKRIIDIAFVDIHRMVRDDLKRLVVLESKETVEIIKESLP